MTADDSPAERIGGEVAEILLTSVSLLNEGAGSDTLHGGEGSDLFVFGDEAGRDVVRDFVNGQDKLTFVGAEGFSDLSFATKGAHTVVSFGEIDVLLRKTSEADLDQSDFVF